VNQPAVVDQNYFELFPEFTNELPLDQVAQIFATSTNLNEIQRVENKCIISVASKSYPQHDKALDTIFNTRHSRYTVRILCAHDFPLFEKFIPVTPRTLNNEGYLLNHFH